LIKPVENQVEVNHALGYGNWVTRGEGLIAQRSMNNQVSIEVAVSWDLLDLPRGHYIPFVVVVYYNNQPVEQSSKFGLVHQIQVPPGGVVSIDGNPAEWGVIDCTDRAPGLHFATINNLPQWIWCDPIGDERTDFSNPDPRVDLVEFRATGDSEYLYILLKFRDLNFYIGDNGATFIAIAINRNGTGVGEWLQATRIHE